MSESEEVMTVTLAIPKRLAAVLEDAARSIDITHGAISPREALILHLIERGARSVSTYDRAGDQRSMASVSIAEFADVMGISDLEATRRTCREAREAHEKMALSAGELFRDVEGVRQVNVKRRIGSAQELTEFAAKVAESMAEHPTIAIVLAVAYVDTSGPTPNYLPVPVSETIN